MKLAPGLNVVARLRAAGCVYAEQEARLLVASAASPAELDAMTDRRASGVPLEHVLGWAEFCGLRIDIDPGVFVPRRRSEFLVSQAVAVAAATPGDGCPLVVVDLCCGSGAIGAAVVSALGRAGLQADLHAVDIDPAAVECARRNLTVTGGQVHQGDLFSAVPPDLRRRVDIVVVNAPYVPTAEIGLMPAEARLHEPLVALDGGPDGVSVHRRVAAAARDWLAPAGSLLIETSERQTLLTAAAITAGGLTATVVTDDELDATVVIGSLAAVAAPAS